MAKLFTITDLFTCGLHKKLEDPITIALNFLNVIWSDPFERNVLIKCLGHIFRVYIILLGILSVADLCFVTDIWRFASNIEGLMIALQVKIIKWLYHSMLHYKFPCRLSTIKYCVCICTAAASFVWPTSATAFGIL